MSRRTTMRTILLGGLGASLLLLGTIAACSQSQESSQQHLVDNDQGHGLHIINSDRLRLLMDELRGLDFERVSLEVAVGKRDKAKITKIAETAATLAADARMIPTIFKNMEMDDENRRVFDRLSMRLHDQCRELKQLADRRDTGKIKAKLDEIISTCNACHASFRGPQMAGVVKSPRPSKST